MKIRFLQTTSSSNPDFPFQAGQVIDVADPSPDLLALLDGVQAEAVVDAPETAMEDEALERATLPRAKNRRR